MNSRLAILPLIILATAAGHQMAGAEAVENPWPNVIFAEPVESGSYLTIAVDHVDPEFNVTMALGPRLDQGATGVLIYDENGKQLFGLIIWSTGLRGNGTFVKSEVGPYVIESDTFPGTNELYPGTQVPSQFSISFSEFPTGRFHFVLYHISLFANVTFYLNGTHDRVIDSIQGHDIHFLTERDFRGPLSLAHENEAAGARFTGPVTTSIEVKNRVFGIFEDAAYYSRLWCVGYSGTGTYLCPTFPPPVPLHTFAYEKPSGEKVACRGYTGCGFLDSTAGKDERGLWKFEYAGIDYYTSGYEPSKKCQRPPLYPFFGEVCEIERPGNSRPILFVLDPKFPGEV